MANKSICAGIDIGTNTLLMTIGYNENGKLIVLEDYHSIVRLGEDLNQNGYILDSACNRAVESLNKCKILCEKHGVTKINAVATSAMRDASNSENIKALLEKALGNEIYVIHGEEEAKLSFLGTVEDDSHSVVIDIGGGSTEIVFGKGSEIMFRKSLQIGAVRLSEKFFSSLPPTTQEINLCVEFIAEHLKSVDFNAEGFKFYAVAGTPTTLSAISQGLSDFSYDKIHGSMLSANEIERVTDMLEHSSHDRIVNEFRVDPRRADIILAGALILKQFAIKYAVDEIIVSAHGLRYGALKEIL